MTGQVTYAGRIRAGDAITTDDGLAVVERVKRAQGRKPPDGENLHVIVEGGRTVKVNSLDPVRVVRDPA